MPLFAGLDVHKEEIEAALINETGAVVLRHRFACERSATESFAQKHLTKACVALEATTHCWAVAALLEPFCQEVVVSNPLKTRATAEAKVKTDKGRRRSSGATFAQQLPATRLDIHPPTPFPLNRAR